MTTTIKVHVGGNYRTTVKHVAGGLDRDTVEIGPNEERSFSFVGDVGENVFFVGPEVHVSIKPALDAQEESKRAAQAKAGIPSQRKEEMALAAQTGRPLDEAYKLDPATVDKLDNLHDREINEDVAWSSGTSGAGPVSTAESEKAQAEIQADAIEKKGAENAAKNPPSAQSSPAPAVATKANTVSTADAKKAEDDKKAAASASAKK